MAKTWIVLRTHDGQYLTQLDQFISWELARTLNQKGAWNIILDGDIDRRLLDVDRLVEFWRQPTDGKETLLGVGFMRRWGFTENTDGVVYTRCSGPDQIDLLDRRVVANYAESSQASKAGPADDMMKEIIDEQYINTTNRITDIYYSRSSAISAAHLSIAPDEGEGRSLDKQFAWRRVLTVLQDLAEASQWPTTSIDGIPVYFDLEYTGPAKFVFRTYPYRYGIDRTVTGGIAPVIFSKERANLANPSIEWIYEEEKNMVIGGGPGQESARMIDPENDPARHNASVWNYQESFKDARESKTLLSVATVAFVEMQRKLPYVEFNGSLLDTPRSRFGVDWNYGDEVTCQYMGLSFDGIVDSFHISVDAEGVEHIGASVKITEGIEGNPD